MSRRPRVCLLITKATGDGPSAMVADLVACLSDRYDLTVGSLTTATGDFERRVDGHITALWEFGAAHRVSGTILAALIRRLRLERPDVLHTHLSRADWYGRLAGRAAGVPCIVSTIHSLHSRVYRSDFGPAVGAIGQSLDRLTGGLADRLVAVSGGVRSDLLASGVPSERVALVRNGVALRRCADVLRRDEVRRAWGVTDEEVVVGTAAGLKPAKALDDLLAAVESLVQRGERCRLVVFGGGPLGDDLIQETRDRGLESVVHWRGWRERAWRSFSGFDIFVLPSRWEGLSIALLEAMATGLPCVGTRVPGIEDVIVHGESGWLVPPSDPPALADGLGTLLQDPGRRARLGAAARARVRAHFTAERMADEYEQLYRTLLQRPTRIRTP